MKYACSKYFRMLGIPVTRQALAENGAKSDEVVMAIVSMLDAAVSKVNPVVGGVTLKSASCTSAPGLLAWT